MNNIELLMLSYERVIFDGGISLYRTESGFCTHLNSKGGPININPVQLTEAGLSPLLGTLRLHAGVPMTIILNSNGNGVRHFSAMGLFERHGFHVFSLDYLSNALLYHFDALARNYETIRDRFREVTLIPGAELSNEVNFSYQPEPYFEFDAVISTARRAYDSCRYILWQRWGPSKGTIPSSFSRTLPLCTGLNQIMRDDLTRSWESYGRKLTDYRDCIQHYIPVDFGIATIFMKQLLPGVWSASARIPDNPEARSKSAFRFTLRLDALSFAWEVAVEVNRVISMILEQSYKEAGSSDIGN